MITRIEQETSDIAWFFTNGNEIGFVASGGGKLPNSISIKSNDEIELLAHYFEALPPITDVIVNPEVKNFITPGTNRNEYISYFSEMSKKGLFAFDKAVMNRFSDTNYQLVTQPTSPLNAHNLPPEILNLLNQTSITGNIEKYLDVANFNERHNQRN